MLQQRIHREAGLAPSFGKVYRTSGAGNRTFCGLQASTISQPFAGSRLRECKRLQEG